MQRIAGIIIEYNPLHKGHCYHIEQTKSVTGCDGVIGVMSGDFVQRGEPAIVDKQVRTRMALQAGVNLVLEIPAVYAIQDAGGFAIGSVGVLDRTGVVTDLVFGSESGDIADLEGIASRLYAPDETLISNQRKYMKMGYSFPNIRKKALGEDLAIVSGKEPTFWQSNNILGVEYLKALKFFQSSIQPQTIQRRGAAYNVLDENEIFSSASAIRKWIRQRDEGLGTGLEDEAIKRAMTPESYALLTEELKQGRGPANLEQLSAFLLCFLRGRNRDHLQGISGVVEGLDLRFINAAKEADTLQSVLDKVKTKRFTFAKLRRMSLYFLFNIQDTFITESNREGPQYIRVLGFDSIGREILKEMRDRSRIPILSTCSAYIKSFKNFIKKDHICIANDKEHAYISDLFSFELFRKQLELNFRMTDFYRWTFFRNPMDRIMDIQTPPIHTA